MNNYSQHGHTKITAYNRVYIKSKQANYKRDNKEKNMLKKSKIIVAIILIILVSFGSMTTVVADGPFLSGTENNPVQLPINKILRMPIGTNTPDAEFLFTATAVSVDGSTDAVVVATAPALANLRVEINASTPVLPADSYNIIRATQATENIFHNVTFPHAGIFVYDITETPRTNPAIDYHPHDVMLYDDTVYRITVHVSNHSNRTDTFISAVTIVEGRYDNGSWVFEDTRKRDRLEFINNFVRTNRPIDPDNPTEPKDPVPDVESTLFVRKNVDGDLGNRERFFDFTMTLTVPDLGQPIPAYFRAFVVETRIVDGVNVDYVLTNIADNASGATTGVYGNHSYMRIYTSGATNFHLRHNQRLVFVDTPVGTHYTVTEAATDHETTIEVMTHNAVVSGITELTTGLQRVGEQYNHVIFLNIRDFITPTGLSMNDLPFIGIILLAIGALTVFVVVKVRNRRQYF